MVKTVGKLRSELNLDKSKYEKGLKGAKKSTQGFAKFLQKAAKIMAALFAVKIVFQWAKALKNAYQTQMEQEIKLQTIMRTRMGLGKEAVNDLKKQASAYQKIGVIGDEVQLAGLQQLATFLRQKESLEALLPAMNNLLAQQRGYNAKATDAVGIANLMGKVLDGQVSALKRVGISFSESQANALKFGTELEKAAVLSEVITGNVGETNKALGATPLGKIKKWQNAWGDFKEMLGGKIVPLLGKFAEWGMKTLPKIGENFNDIRKKLVGIANNFIDVYNESLFFRTAVETIGATFKTLSSIVKGVFDGIILMTKGAGQLLKDIFMGNWKELGANADQVMIDVFNNFKDMGKDVGDHWEKRMENITGKKYIQYIEIKPAPGGLQDQGPIIKKPEPFDPKKLGGDISGPSINIPDISAPNLAGLDAAFDDPINKAMDFRNTMADVNDKIAIYGGAIMQFTDSLAGMFEATMQRELALVDTVAAKTKKSDEWVAKEKEKILKKYGKKKKIAAIREAIINAALGVTAALTLPPPLSFIMAGLTAAMGAIQIATIRGTPMAEGGIVPGGYPNDTYPALLTSGEMVTPPDELGFGRNRHDLNVKFEGELGLRGEDFYWSLEEVKRKRRDNF